MKLECIAMPEPYQFKTVSAGETETVLYIPITGGYVGFIDEVACDWFANTFLEFIVDGALKEKIEREIPFSTPKEYNPPIVATKWIKFIAHNEDTSDHVFGVLVDGTLCRPRR